MIPPEVQISREIRLVINAARELVLSYYLRDDLAQWTAEAVSAAGELYRFCDEHCLAQAPLSHDVLDAVDQIAELYYIARNCNLDGDGQMHLYWSLAEGIKNTVKMGRPKSRSSPGWGNAPSDNAYIHRPVGGPEPPGRFGNGRKN